MPDGGIFNSKVNILSKSKKGSRAARRPDDKSNDNDNLKQINVPKSVSISSQPLHENYEWKMPDLDSLPDKKAMAFDVETPNQA